MVSQRPSDAPIQSAGSALPTERNGLNAPQMHDAAEQSSPLIDDEKKPSMRGASRESTLGFLKPWWMEIIACVLVLLAILAIVLTLALHQNQPLPNWPFGISVNSLVSVFVVILKGGMLLILGEGISQAKWAWFRSPRPLGHFNAFHEGSQGPMGAAALLWTLRGRHIATSIAALITIVALAIDPFTQQIIEYYSQPLELSGRQAGIPRTNNFTQGGGIAGLPINQPLYNGFFSSGQAGDSNPLFDCPTGNCTFDPYYTVGICSDCNDITSRVVVSKNCDVCRTPDSGFQGDSCTQTLPASNLTITQCDFDGIAYTSSTKVSAAHLMSLQSPLNLAFTSAYFQAMMYSGNQKGCPGSDAPYFSENGSCLRAVECGLYPCVRGYEGEVKSGNFTEKLVSTQPMPLASSTFKVDDVYCFYALRLACVSQAGINVLKTKGYAVAEGQDWLQYNCSSRVENARTIPDQCIYEFSYIPAQALGQYFGRGFFDGTVETAIVGFVDGLDYSVQLQVLYDAGNNTLETINNTMGRVAEFLTTYVRENGDESNSAAAPGTVFQNETFIRVRWAWFTLPAALALFTLIFFVYTLVEIARHERDTNWKSSPLPLLFHGLDAETRDRYSRLDGLDEMDEKAKEVIVRLHGDGQGGWRIAAVGK